MGVGLVCLAHLARPASAKAEGPAPALKPRVRLKGAPGASARRAIEGARLRLTKPPCLKLLTDFTDASGLPLEHHLQSMGVSAADYVGVLVFLEGSSQSVCQSGNALGGTRPGSRVIFLCGEAFARTVLSNPRLAEAVIIHEMLHSLGLGENPPSSQEITSRVLKSCSDRAAIATRTEPEP